MYNKLYFSFIDCNYRIPDNLKVFMLLIKFKIMKNISLPFVNLKTQKAAFFVFCLFLNNIALSQHFEWAASASNVDLSYPFSSVDISNNIVVGGEALRNYTHKGKAEIYDAEGEIIETDNYLNEKFIILSYSPQGKVNWKYTLSSRYTELHGITHDGNGNTVLLVNVLRLKIIDENYYGAIPEINNRDYIPSGYYLIYINSYGSFVKKKKVFTGNHTKLSIRRFISYPNGGFVLSGFASPGKFCDELEVEAGKSGGDFILVLDKNGSVNWADVVSYTKKTCCSYFSEMCKVAVSPNGDIYLGGTYKEGAVFGSKKTIISSQKSVEGKNLKSYEAYVASYSPAGKLNWVKTSGNRAIFKAIIASNKGVFISYNLTNFSNKAFGERIDTSDNKLMVISCFNKKGKLKWTKSTSTDRAHDLRLDRENNLYVLGTFRTRSVYRNRMGKIGNDTINPENKVFIARFSENGKYHWVKEADIPVTTINDPLHLLMDNCNNMYLTGTLWFVLPATMSWWDKAFVKGKGYGGAPLISRFKNTIPEEVSEKINKKVNEGKTCVISPGPWKIRNYPNPFSDNTTIEYTLSYPDKATIEVYDLNGKLIHKVFENKNHQAGTFSVKLNKPLSAGAYLLTIKGTETIATRKISVLK